MEHRTPHKHITRKHESRNADGSLKTLDQMMRATLKLRDFARYLESQQKAGN